MRKIINHLFRKLTAGSVIGLALLAVGIPGAIYMNTLEGLKSLGSAYLLMGALIGLVLLLIDRVAIIFVAQRKLSLIELALLAAGVLAYSYSNRKIFIEIGPGDYFVLIENNGNFQDSERRLAFPFHKRIASDGNSAVINSISANIQKINIESPADWGGYLMTTQEVEDTRVQFYSKYGMGWADKEIDSLIGKEIKSAANN